MMCSARGCDRTARARWLCAAHYEAARVRGELDAHPFQRQRSERNPCVVDGYDRPDRGRAHGLCAKHRAAYYRQRAAAR